MKRSVTICTLAAQSEFRLAGILALNLDRHGKPRNEIPIAKIEPQKPLPTKVIPRPEPLPPAPVAQTQPQQVEVVQTQKQYDIFNANTGGEADAESEFIRLKAKLESENKAKAASEAASEVEALNNYWTKAVPYYNRAIVSLRDILLTEAARRGDGIAQSDGYFQCLPPILNSDISGRKLAEIRFQKNTNVDFFIEIKGDLSAQRPLRVSCSGGLLEIHPNPSMDRMARYINMQGVEQTEAVPIEEADGAVKDGLTMLIGLQEHIMNSTNNK